MYPVKFNTGNKVSL